MVKEDILKVISSHYGDTTAHAFSDTYQEQILPIFSEAAVKILSDLIGEEKARDSVETIYHHYKIERGYV